MNTEKHLSIFISICIIIVATFSCEKKIEQSLSTTKKNSTHLRNGTTFYGDDIEIVVDTSGYHPIIQRRLLTPNSTGEALLYDMTSIDLSNGFMVFNPQKTYWLIPFDITTQALVISSPPDCISKSCGGTCSLERQSNGCLRCECSTSGDCDMVIGYAFDTGVIVEGSEIEVIDQ